ncbi:hypothetical protein MMC22_007069 [Lobaria immixta]|nr:hypothetical protein [Lobaria immixta]
MTKLLVIQGLEETYVYQSYLFTQMESEVLKDCEIYATETTMEAIELLRKHSFQAVVSFPMEPRRTSEIRHLHKLLAEHIRTGGTLILAGHYLDARWRTNAPWRSTRLGFNGNFDLEGQHINDYDSCYVLNPEMENLFGPSVFASLDTTICTNMQLVGDFPDSAKIYRSALESGCPAAFVKHDKGYIGYLISMPATRALETLLLAMLEHAMKRPPPLPASNPTSSIPIPLSSEVASDASGAFAQVPHLVNANPGCAVCRTLVPAKNCGRCRLAQYCSTKCQIADWKSHQAICVASEDENAPSTVGPWTPTSTIPDAQERSADEWGV